MLTFLSFLDITSCSYTKDSVRLYKHAYVALRNAVNAYVLLGALPALKETIKPTNPKAQQAANRLLREEVKQLRNVNTAAREELLGGAEDADLLNLAAISGVFV